VSKLLGGMLLALCALVAQAQQEFKIGVVASLSRGFAAAAKDSMDGWRAWEKARGLPGKKIMLETLDDETNPVSASNAKGCAMRWSASRSCLRSMGRSLIPRTTTPAKTSVRSSWAS